MLKKTQKIIVVTVILLTLIILISLSGLLYIQSEVYRDILKQNEIDIEKVNDIKTKVDNIKNISILVSAIFIIIAILVSNVLSKSILIPIQELVQSAQIILKGDSVSKKILKANKEKDQIDNLVEMFSDMNSDLKDNLSEITRKKNEIETILLHMTDGVISFDVYGRITHINLAAKEALDVDENARFKTIFTKFGLEPDMEKLSYLQKLTSQKLVYTNKNKIYNVLFATISTDENKIDGIVVVIQDITEHVKLDQMRKQFVADVSHELKTPITSIMGYSETILDTMPDKETVQYFISKINNEANRMSELVTDLLILSKYDKENNEKRKTNFDVSEIVKEYVEILKKEADKKHIELKCYVTANIPNINGDKSGIIRVITNIISNAIKYTPENGIIEVYVGFLYRDVYVKVKDNGIGISKEDLPRVFERFYRVDSSRVRKSGGSGLGLAIAKEIMDKNSGKIDIKSELGKGTEVVLRFKTAINSKKIK